MIKSSSATLAVLASTQLALGWYFGERAASEYFTFWLLALLLVFSSVRLARCAFGAIGLVDTFIRSAVVAFALTVLAGLLLGSLGLISRASYLGFFIACAGASVLAKQRPQSIAVPGIPVVLAALVVPVLTFVIAVGVTQSPLTLYDSLSYHLFFPARWLQEHRLTIIATPFSDEAQAYAPANGELWFLWLMLSFHGDLLAKVGQLPFLLLGTATLYGLARQMGAKPAHAIYPAVFYLLTKRVIEQAVGADVDLVCWDMFLASLYIGIAAIKSNEPRDWLLWGISLGLYFGTKYVSLVYAPVVLLLPLLGDFRRRAIWLVPGLAVFAAPWYLRNWIVAGSPIYPSSIIVAGLTIARGAYTRAAMMNSILHASGLQLLPVMLSLAFGATLFFLWIPFALLGAWNVVSARPRRTTLFLLLAPVVMAILYWYGVPDNLDCRFLLPVTMLALLPFAFVFRASHVWNAAMQSAFIAGALWVLFSRVGELPFAVLPWPIGNWLTFTGMIDRGYVWWFIGLAIASGMVPWVIHRTDFAVTALAAMVCAGSISFAVSSPRWCPPVGCQFLELSSTYIRPDMITAWRWFSEHVTGATVAYTGNNLPYALVGPRLSNRVYYVNIDHHRDWRFHNYDTAHRRHPPGLLPPTTLASSSGLLKPLPGRAEWQVDAVRPRYERMEGNRDAWLRNLKSLGVRYVFASVLSVYDIDYMWHTAAGFPVEEEWARQEPDIFTMVYENPEVRVFELHLN
jgi:hypothetical protein